MTLINVRSTASRVDVLKQLIANAERTLTLVKGMDRHFRELTQHPEAEYGMSRLTGQMADQADAIASMRASIQSLAQINVDYQQWHLFAGMNSRIETLHVERRSPNLLEKSFIWFEDWKNVISSVVYWLGAGDRILIEIPSQGYKEVRTVENVVESGDHQHKIDLAIPVWTDPLIEIVAAMPEDGFTAGSITLLQKAVT